jgi:hypothetical protein
MAKLGLRDRYRPWCSATRPGWSDRATGHRPAGRSHPHNATDPIRPRPLQSHPRPRGGGPTPGAPAPPVPFVEPCTDRGRDPPCRRILLARRLATPSRRLNRLAEVTWVSHPGVSKRTGCAPTIAASCVSKFSSSAMPICWAHSVHRHSDELVTAGVQHEQDTAERITRQKLRVDTQPRRVHPTRRRFSRATRTHAQTRRYRCKGAPGPFRRRLRSRSTRPTMQGGTSSTAQQSFITVRHRQR